MKRLLVATRGPLAARAINSCRRLGFSPIAVAARSDPQQSHVAGADACVYLEGSTVEDTYDSVDAIVEAAKRGGADAVYPGCRALAEEPELPRRLANLGIGYVGPRASALARASDKPRTVATAARLTIPVLPHATGGRSIRKMAARSGYPVILKPQRGCLGAGVRVVYTDAELERVLDPEDQAGRTEWYAERYVPDGRVVGVTVAVDAAGDVVELGERECLLVAAGHKLVDASPLLTVRPETAVRIRRDAARLAVALGLHNVATVEFIVTSEGYFLLEVNARLAGAYRMCEAQTGLDLVALQLEIADGRTLDGVDIVADRAVHCIEARLYLRADPALASRRASKLSCLRLPPVAGVSYDCGVDELRPLLFEDMVNAILAVGPSREAAKRRLLRAAEASEVSGVSHYRGEIVDWARRTGIDGEACGTDGA